MRARGSAVVVGAFTVGGVLLGAGLLLAAGVLHPFERVGQVRIMFDESLNGVEQGAPVKLRGVMVGTVTSVQVLCDLDTRRTAVLAACDLWATGITDGQSEPLDLASAAVIQQLVQKGMRASLGLEGITGLRFVALDFYEPDAHPAVVPAWVAAPDVAVIPAVRSAVAEIAETLPALLVELRDLRLGEISQGLEKLLATLNRKAESLQLESLVTSVQEATTSLNAFLGQGAGVLQNLERMLDGRGSLATDLAHTLDVMAKAAASFRRLADYLERHPDALLTGRSIPVSR